MTKQSNYWARCYDCGYRHNAPSMIKLALNAGNHIEQVHGNNVVWLDCRNCGRHFQNSPDASVMQQAEAHMRQEHPEELVG